MELLLIASLWKAEVVIQDSAVWLGSLDWWESLAIPWVCSKIKDFQGSLEPQLNMQGNPCPFSSSDFKHLTSGRHGGSRL